MIIEAYAWNDTDEIREIFIRRFQNIEDAQIWLKSQNTVNKLLATSPEEISSSRTLIWGGK